MPEPIRWKQSAVLATGHHARRVSAIAFAIILFVAASCSGDPSYQSRSADDWAAQLQTGVPSERESAARAFATASPRQFQHIRPLLLATGDADAGVRRASDSAIARLVPDASKALARALQDTSVVVRRAAAMALGRLNEGAKVGVPALIAATSDADDSVRTIAVKSLGELGPSAYAALTRVRELATNAGPQRAAALKVLPFVDTESRSLYGVFASAMTDTSPAVRAAAAWTLPLSVGDAKVDPVPLLVAALSDTVPAVRAAAVRSLALLSERDTNALHAIRKIETRGDSVLRRLIDSVAASRARSQTRSRS